MQIKFSTWTNVLFCPNSAFASCCVVALVILCWCPQARGQNKPAEKKPKPAATDPDEASIRKSADEFVAAFDRQDAATIARQWTKEGTYVDETGQVFKGREAIQKIYQEFFKDHKDSKPKLHVAIKSIRKITPKVAIEDGVAVLTSASAVLPTASNYIAIHVKQDDGSWLLDEVRDSPLDTPLPSRDLSHLDVLVGDWTASHAGVDAEITCSWNPNKTVMERHFALSKDGKDVLTSIEIVAWDPLSSHIASWSFSSDGGRSEGVWTPLEDGWIVRSSGITSEGLPTYSVDAWAPLLDDAMGWKSIERYVGGEPAKGVRHVVLKKKAKPADRDK